MGNEQVLISYSIVIAAQMLDFMVACLWGPHFATPDALKGGLLNLLQEIRPTFIWSSKV